MGWEETLRALTCLFCWGKISTKYTMSISISGSNLTTGVNNTVLSPPYGSLSFNGINQSVVTSGTGSGATTGSVLDITTGAPNYTIEFWIYSSEHSRVNVPQYFLNQGNGQTVQFQIASGEISYTTYGSNILKAAFYSTTLGYVEMSSWPTTIALNTWYHVALCKDTSNGNRYYLYLNGVLVSSTPNIANLAANNGQPWEFGFPPSYIVNDQSYALNGLLSNIRIVKGVALYVPPNVTVPTPPLAATQSLNLAGYNQAITGTQTSLLLNTSYLVDSSTYTQGVTGVNSPTSSTLAPYSYTVGNAGSILFNGSSQYLSISSSTAFNMGTNSFTVEGWIYLTAYPASANGGLFGTVNGSTSGYYLNPGQNINSLRIISNASGTWQDDITVTAGNGVPLNSWTHLAMVRNGDSLVLYKNGVSVASRTGVSSWNYSSTATNSGYVGSANVTGTRYYVTGYISNVRVVKGVAVYTSAFVPSTTSLTSTQSANTNGNPSSAIIGTQTSLLLNTTNDGNYLTDSSTNNFTVTNNGTATSNSLNPYGGGSILFNGTNQYLYIARATQFNYSTNDFTWEMWIYPTSATWTSGSFYLIDHGPSANQGSLHYTVNRLVYYNYYNANNTPPYTAGANYPSLYTIGGGTIAANTWTHIAVCRQNLVTNMFINGQLVSSGPDPYDYAVTSNAPFSNPIVSPATQSVTIGARTDGAYVFKGNISNVRIVNGVSVYNVGNFTPPVQPLPAIQGPNNIGSPSKSITSNQTSLLVSTPYNNTFLKDGSFNGVTLTQQTVGQYPPSTYTLTSNSTNPFNSNGSIFTPGSIFFNGTSQYLSVPSSAVFGFGTGDFTVEGWFYATSDQGTDFMIDFRGSSSPTAPAMFVYTSNYLTWYYNGNVVYQPTSLTFTYNTWNHVAIVRASGVTRFYLNGIGATTTYTDTNDYPAAPCIIGSDVLAGGPNYWNGYISNVRVVKGTAVYTQNFIPTSGPFTTSQTFSQSGIPSCPVQSSQTELLLTTPSNSSYLTDSSTNAFTVTNVGTATSTPFNPFSGNYEILANPGSVLFNGTTQYLTVPSSSAFNFGTGDYTVETWVNWTTLTTSAIFNSESNNGFNLYYDTGSFLTNYLVVSNRIVNQLTYNWIPSVNTWYHIAISRSGTNLRMFINGVLVATNAADTTNYATSSYRIGSDVTQGWYLNGYISNLRAVNGVAVYTSAFTPPPGPLNNSQVANQSGAPSAAVTVSQTSLLLNTAFGTNFLTDGSINNFTVTNFGTATSATLDPFVFTPKT